jgi:hypothetical protein
MLLLMLLAGCDGSSTGTTRGGAGGPETTPPQRAEILAGTMETLFGLEEYEFGQAEELVMSRLNQWLRGQEIKIPWQREPRLDDLSARLAGIRGVRSLANDTFLYQQDFEFLREAVWMRRITDQLRGTEHTGNAPSNKAGSNEAARPKGDNRESVLQFASAEDPEELRLAMRLFDWIVANVQLEDDVWPEKSVYKLPRNWHTPYETVLMGRGTASDRAWTFILLARQLGLSRGYPRSFLRMAKAINKRSIFICSIRRWVCRYRVQAAAASPLWRKSRPTMHSCANSIWTTVGRIRSRPPIFSKLPRLSKHRPAISAAA